MNFIPTETVFRVFFKLTLRLPDRYPLAKLRGPWLDVDSKIQFCEIGFEADVNSVVLILFPCSVLLEGFLLESPPIEVRFDLIS